MLRAIADNLWTYDRSHKVLGLDIGARMTIIRTGNRRLWLHSPVRFDGAVAEEISKLGTVTALIAPSKMHYLFVPEAKSRFPGAHVLAPSGLREKRPNLPIDALIGEAPKGALPEELDYQLMGGMPGLNEVVFLHRPSHTLIATDLFFNYVTVESWLLRAYLKVNDAYGKPKMTGLLRKAVRDRHALSVSRDMIMAWDFDRVIVAHGEIIPSGGKAVVADVLGWV